MLWLIFIFISVYECIHIIAIEVYYYFIKPKSTTYIYRYLVASVLGLIRSVLGLIISCTNVTLFNVINFQFTGHKLAYLRATGTLYLAQLIHVCQDDLHSNNLLGWILCFNMYIYNKITL